MAATDDPTPGTITSLIHQAHAGDALAHDQLAERVLGELRAMASARISRYRADDSFDSTALVNDAYLRMLQRGGLAAENRRHFFFLLHRAMRDVLVEQIRGGYMTHRPESGADMDLVEFRSAAGNLRATGAELNAALDELAGVDADAAHAVMLIFMCGLTLAEASTMMDCTFSVTRGHWEYARAWLQTRLARGRTPLF